MFSKSDQRNVTIPKPHFSEWRPREISFEVKPEDQTLVEKAFNIKHVLWSVSACDYTGKKDAIEPDLYV